MKLPETHGQWQAAVNDAHALLNLRRAQQAGLVHFPGQVKHGYCEWVLHLGLIRGIAPRHTAAELLADLAG